MAFLLSMLGVFVSYTDARCSKGKEKDNDTEVPQWKLSNNYISKGLNICGPCVDDRGV